MMGGPPPQVRLGGVVVDEPATVVTDAAIAIFCFLAAQDLMGLVAGGGPRALAVGLWAGAFAATGLAAIAGGAVHGWGARLGHRLRSNLWLFTLLSMAAMSLLMVVSSALVATRGTLRALLLTLAVAKSAAFLELVRRRRSYGAVVLDYGAAMAAVLVLQMVLWWRGEGAAAWIVGGVLLSAVAIVIQRLELGVHRYFNHNDVYHVVQIPALVLFFRGGRLLANGT